MNRLFPLTVVVALTIATTACNRGTSKPLEQRSEPGARTQDDIAMLRLAVTKAVFVNPDHLRAVATWALRDRHGSGPWSWDQARDAANQAATAAGSPDAAGRLLAPLMGWNGSLGLTPSVAAKLAGVLVTKFGGSSGDHRRLRELVGTTMGSQPLTTLDPLSFDALANSVFAGVLSPPAVRNVLAARDKSDTSPEAAQAFRTLTQAMAYVLPTLSRPELSRTAVLHALTELGDLAFDPPTEAAPQGFFSNLWKGIKGMFHWAGQVATFIVKPNLNQIVKIARAAGTAVGAFAGAVRDAFNGNNNNGLPFDAVQFVISSMKTYLDEAEQRLTGRIELLRDEIRAVAVHLDVIQREMRENFQLVLDKLRTVTEGIEGALRALDALAFKLDTLTADLDEYAQAFNTKIESSALQQFEAAINAMRAGLDDSDTAFQAALTRFYQAVANRELLTGQGLVMPLPQLMSYLLSPNVQETEHILAGIRGGLVDSLGKTLGASPKTAINIDALVLMLEAAAEVKARGLDPKILQPWITRCEQAQSRTELDAVMIDHLRARMASLAPIARAEWAVWTHQVAQSLIPQPKMPDNALLRRYLAAQPAWDVTRQRGRIPTRWQAGRLHRPGNRQVPYVIQVETDAYAIEGFDVLHALVALGILQVSDANVVTYNTTLLRRKELRDLHSTRLGSLTVSETAGGLVVTLTGVQQNAASVWSALADYLAWACEDLRAEATLKVASANLAAVRDVLDAAGATRFVLQDAAAICLSPPFQEDLAAVLERPLLLGASLESLVLDAKGSVSWRKHIDRVLAVVVDRVFAADGVGFLDEVVDPVAASVVTLDPLLGHVTARLRATPTLADMVLTALKS